MLFLSDSRIRIYVFLHQSVQHGSGAKIPFDGQVCNLSLLRPYLTGNERTVRRQAWKAYSDYFMTVADELDYIYDKLVKNRTAQAKAMYLILELHFNICKS